MATPRAWPCGPPSSATLPRHRLLRRRQAPPPQEVGPRARRATVPAPAGRAGLAVPLADPRADTTRVAGPSASASRLGLELARDGATCAARRRLPLGG